MSAAWPPPPASPRDRVGKGSARALRLEGKTPAVVYGDKQPPLAIAVNTKETFLKLHAGGFLTHVVTLKVDGKEIRVLPRDYQLDPVTDTLVHVDFIRVSDTTKVRVDVPVHFIGQEKSAGIKRGGVLNITAHEVALLVSANNIPEHLTVDIGALDIGDSVHISAVTLPEGAKLVEHDDFSVAAIVGSAAGTSEETAAPAAEAAPAPATKA
ncbi:MAG: rplY [Proteobacteria bacterium]|nr:rplY [Pseudomonadota bacterium]